jgi:hypothetical protein
MDVVFTGRGWIAAPYKIEHPKGWGTSGMGPASGDIILGDINDGEYFLKIMLNNSVESFRIHRQGNKFWIEEAEASMGSVEQMSDFEMRIDGFTIDFDSETSEEVILHVLDLIRQTGAEIIDAYVPQQRSVSIRFYFDASFNELADIIRYFVKQYPHLSIRIRGNDGHIASAFNGEEYMSPP